MAVEHSPICQLPYILPSQSQKHVTHNEALAMLDVLVQMSVLDRDLAAPPGSPVEGDRYIVAASPTGAWAGKAGKIAYRRDGAWEFLTPRSGWLAYAIDETTMVYFTGSAWATIASMTPSALNNLTLLGVGTTADATNPFSAKLNKALWTAKTAAEGGDGDLRYTMNKETAADVVSLLMQRGFSGRAEIGLIGDDDVTLKVSPDGSAWKEAMRVDATTARATGRQGGVIPAIQVSVIVTDTAGSNVNTAQPVFPTAQDEITLEANTTYAFEAEYSMSRAAGTTSHTTGVLFGGTAVIASIGFMAQVTNPTGNLLAAVQQIWGAAATLLTLTSTNTVSTENLNILLKGTLRTGTAGTLIPQFQYSAAPGGAPTIRRNTAFRIWPMGVDTLAAAGQWA